jgi:hypothetical protein
MPVRQQACFDNYKSVINVAIELRHRVRPPTALATAPSTYFPPVQDEVVILLSQSLCGLTTSTRTSRGRGALARVYAGYQPSSWQLVVSS